MDADDKVIFKNWVEWWVYRAEYPTLIMFLTIHLVKGLALDMAFVAMGAFSEVAGHLWFKD